MGMIFVDCFVHGRVPCQGIITGTININLVGLSAHCQVPGCGLISPIVNGTYEFANNLLKSFKSLSVSDLLELQTIATQLHQGLLDHSQTRKEIAARFPKFLDVWDWANKNSGALTVFIAIIALLLQFYSVLPSKSSPEQAFQHGETRSEVDHSEYEVLQSLYGLLKGLPLHVQTPEWRDTHSSPTQQASPSQRPALGAGPNRHERRKAASLARRKDH